MSESDLDAKIQRLEDEKKGLIDELKTAPPEDKSSLNQRIAGIDSRIASLENQRPRQGIFI